MKVTEEAEGRVSCSAALHHVSTILSSSLLCGVQASPEKYFNFCMLGSTARCLGLLASTGHGEIISGKC